MTLWLWGSVVIGLTVVAAIVGMLLVRRSVSLNLLENHHEVAGFIYAVVGVVYAVLVAFVVILVWEQYKDAEANVDAESNQIANLYYDTLAFPIETRSLMQGLIQNYLDQVISKEWSAMARGEDSEVAWKAFNALWQAYIDYKPQTAQASIWYEETIDDLNKVGDFRRLRLLSSREAVPNVMWVVLFLGGAITIGFSYLFGTKSVVAQSLIVSALASVVALNLFLIATMNHPFRGHMSVQPDAFHELLKMLEHLRS